MLNKTSHEGHVGGKSEGFKTTYSAALRKQMILEMIFKMQRISSDSTIFKNSRIKGKEIRNRLRRLNRKKQTKHNRPQFKKTHIVICKKIKSIIENGEIFLICRRKKIKAPQLDFTK